MITPRLISKMILCLALGLGMSGCLTNGKGGKGSGSSKSSVVASPSPSSAPLIQLTAIRHEAKTGANPPVLTLSYDSGQPANRNIKLYCDPLTGRTCVCKFSWTQVNTTSGEAIEIPRTLSLAVERTQDWSVDCQLPDIYSTSEIDERTPVTVSITPSNASTSAAEFKPYVFNKSVGPSEDGPIKDADGRGFDVIHRYVCFEQFQRGTEIVSHVVSVPHSDPSYSVQVPSATKYCFLKSNGGASSSECQSSPALGNLSHHRNYSNQSYSYTFYTRTGAGIVNPSNLQYKCVKVADSDLIVPKVNNAESLYPFDAQFILAIGRSDLYPVKVNALRTPVANNGGAEVATMGYAALPKRDGSCPMFKDINNVEQPMYRLRRYTAIYPAQFNTNGLLTEGFAPALDTAYILDRPARAPDGSARFAVEGPKPCPFSFYDSKNVTGASANGAYVASNDPRWSGKNIDGIELPNFDAGSGISGVPMSCSAAVALYATEKDGGTGAGPVWSVGTVHPNNANPGLRKAVIQPIEPWAPTYHEDTEFRACAPMAPSPYYREPPLYHYRLSNGEAAWCVKTLPNSIPAHPSGARSIARVANEAQRRLQYHAETPNVSGAYSRYNLTVTAAAAAQALEQEPNYRCRYTIDDGQGRAGVTTPDGACAAGLAAGQAGSTAAGHHEPRSTPPDPADWR